MIIPTKTEILIAGWILTAGGSFLGGWHERVLREPAMLTSQKTADAQACTDAQAITKETNDALQKDRDAIAQRLSALELQPSTCVPVTDKAEPPASGGKHAGSNGVTSRALREFAATCEEYRVGLKWCEEFLDKERVDLK